MDCYLHHLLLLLLLLSVMMSNTSAVYSSFLDLTRVATTSNRAATTNIGGLSLPTFTYSITASLLILASLLFFLIHSHFNMHKFSKTNKTHLPPGPSPWPIVGCLPELCRNKPAFRWIHELMNEMNTNIACIRLGNIHVIPVTCPELACEFLKKHDSVFASRPNTMATELTSRGFLTIAVTPWGDQWKKMRRVVASDVLTPARHCWLHDKRIEEADNLVRYVYNQCGNIGGQVVDIRVAARQYCGNVIRRLIFNKRYFGEGRVDGGPGVEEEEYVDAVFRVFTFVYVFCISDYLPWLRWLDLGGHERMLKDAISIINKYHDVVIDERLREWRDGKDGWHDPKREPEDLLDVLILVKDDEGKPLLSSEEIKAQTAEFIYGSMSTPSHAVEWTLAEIINQPEILQKAMEEIDRVVGKERLVQESDFPKLNYLKACVRESFRLHPISAFNFPHVSTRDTIVAGYFIPKGSHVLLSRMGLGRNPKVWDEPLRFKPERHLKDGLDVDLVEPELRFISFSTGRRGCMGVAFGSDLTIMPIARLLQGFSWEVPPGESCIDLAESTNDLYLAQPLRTLGKPRLPKHLYPVD